MSKTFQDGVKGVPVEFSDGFHIDAFGGLRTSSAINYISTVPLYHTFDHYYDRLVTGTATYTISQTSPHIDILCPAIGDELISQSKTWWTYQAGNSQLLNATGVLDTNIGTISEFGYYGDFNSDGSGFNGVAYGNDENGHTYICLYTSIPGLSNKKVYLHKGEWNGKDQGYIKTKLAGTGLNPSKSQIFAVDLEFLAVGRVRAGFYEAGRFWEAHTFDNANRYTTPYMLTASLPIRYYLKNVSRVGGAAMKQICATVKSEGGREIFGIPQVAKTPGIAVTDGTTKTVLIISPKSLFVGKPNRASVIPVSYAISVTGQGFADIDLIHAERGDITGTFTGTWKDMATSTHSPSACEYVTALDYLNQAPTITNGHVHSGDYASGNVKGDTSKGQEAFLSYVYLNRGINHLNDAKASIYALRVTAVGGNIVAYTKMRTIEIY